MDVKMTSKKNKQKNKTSKTRQLFNENKKENYQSQLLKELKSSIAANKEENPAEKSNNEDKSTPIIIFKKNQY
ncbi:unnamed protein product, partial [marine sediment metagenome]